MVGVGSGPSRVGNFYQKLLCSCPQHDVLNLLIILVMKWKQQVMK